MLVYHGGTFLQALEGDEAAVGKIFRRIEKDPRHAGVCILQSELLRGKRIFGEWSMGFADATGTAHLLRGFLRVQNALQAMDALVACSQGSQRDAPSVPGRA
jgi:hypothetical protein